MNQPSEWPFQAVLFDMDGTLVDTEPLWQQAERLLMARFEVEWTPEDQALCLGGSATRVTRYMADRVAETGAERPDPEELVRDFGEVMLSQLRSDPPDPRPGSAELLAQVAATGLPTALVSSSPRPLMTAVLDAIGDQWFDVTVSADDVPRHKPDPMPYLAAAEMLGVDCARCVAIEDSPPGCESATRAGAFLIAVEHMAEIEPAERRVVVRTLAGVTLEQMANWYRG